jgi:hypothetical protein
MSTAMEKALEALGNVARRCERLEVSVRQHALTNKNLRREVDGALKDIDALLTEASHGGN